MKASRASFAILASIVALALAGCQEAPSKPGSAGSAKAYPLDVCIVSGEKLGSMGDPIVIVHEGQEVKFCCKGCKPDFEKEPAKFLSKLSSKK